ncbi:MAG: hypothetical protein Fur0024_4950 [Patescibacteria group bacterium]
MSRKFFNLVCFAFGLFFVNLIDVKANQFDELKYRADQVGFDISYLNSASDPMPGEIARVTMYFKNTGTETWRKNDDKKVCGSTEMCLGTMLPPSIFDRASILGDTNPTNFALQWITDFRPTKINENAVAPGSVASFTFNIRIPAKPTDTVTEYFSPVIGSTWVRVSEVSLKPVKINLGSNYGYALQSIKVDENFIPNSSIYKKIGGFMIPVEIKLKNTGKSIWYRGNSETFESSVQIGISPSTGKLSSVLGTSDWINPAIATILQEERILPGEVGTFKFNIRSPVVAGIYTEKFRLKVENTEWMSSGEDIILIIQSESPKYSYNVISQGSLPTKMEPGEPKNLTISVRNTGNVPWYRNDGTNPNIFLTKVGTNNPVDRDSMFFVEGVWENLSRSAFLREEKVLPGEIGNFDMTLIAPFAGGKFIEEFSLVVENVAWMDGAKFRYETNIDNPIHTFKFISQQREPGVIENNNPADLRTYADDGHIYMKTGEVKTWWIKLRNTGNYTWRHYNDTGVRYQYKNSTRTRGPGLGNVRFASYCPSEDWGSIYATKGNVDAGVFSGKLFIECKKGYNGRTTPDRKSIFYIPGSWIYDDRLSTFSEEVVPPGGEATFEFKLKAPTTPMSEKEYFRLVNERISWFNDPGVYFEPVVTKDGLPQKPKYETTQSLIYGEQTIYVPLSKTKVGVEEHLPATEAERQEIMNLIYLYRDYKEFQRVNNITKSIEKKNEFDSRLAVLQENHKRSTNSTTTKNTFAINWNLYVTIDPGTGSYVAKDYNGGAFEWYKTGDSESEKYYITMRWPYVKWRWNGSADASDRTMLATMKYYKGKKLLVRNLKNNKSVVVAITESGPAPYTGTCYSSTGALKSECSALTQDKSLFGKIKQFGIDSATKIINGDEIPLIDSNNDGREDINVGTAKAMRGAGLSPEAFEAIGASIDDIIEVGFLVDQSLPLGPVS